MTTPSGEPVTTAGETGVQEKSLDAARIPVLKLAFAGALVGGLVFGVIQETQHQGILFWCFVVVAMALAAASVAIGPGQEAKFRSALKAVPLLIVALLALSLGDFGAYALEIGDRTLEGYSDGTSMSWESKVAATLLIGAIYGALLGLVAAMAAWMLRRAVLQARA
jgi:hypothetical protein